ncbi:MAG TPA: hypothetical protein VMU95_04615 [Trebonia sp.]|nr:hypothetical protein [Trebonia sp.]
MHHKSVKRTLSLAVSAAATTGIMMLAPVAADAAIAHSAQAQTAGNTSAASARDWGHGSWGRGHGSWGWGHWHWGRDHGRGFCPPGIC